MQDWISGVIPILPTPFTADGEVDEGSFRNVIEAAIADGVQGLAMFGLASEYIKLSDHEKQRLAIALVEQTGGRVPVIVSITSHSIEIALRESEAAQRAGADALMVMPPFFMAPGKEAVRGHIARLASAASAQIIVQYAPIQTGVSLSAEDCVALHREHPNISHVKVDVIPSGPMISRLQDLSSGSLRSIVGYMGLHLPEDLARGAAALMPTVSVSGVLVEIFRLLRLDHDRGRRLHERLLPLLNFMMQSVEMLVSVEKILLHRRGLLTSPYCRQPRCSLDSFHMAELEYLCSSFGGRLISPFLTQGQSNDL